MATTSDETKKDGKAFYGYLFTKAKPIPAPTPVFDALLRAIALHITTELGDKSEAHLTPGKLAAFYKTAGHDWDSFFNDMPHTGISTVYQGLGCQHSLLPSVDDFAAPSVPALTTKGFVHWQTIQTLLGPQEQVPVLQFAAAHWALKHPDTGTPLPVDLPKEAFPSETDSETDRWYQECAQIARSKAVAEEQTDVPKEAPKPEAPKFDAPKPESADRKVPYTHVRMNSSTPRDYFASRPVNVAYVHIPSPRATPTGRSPERDRVRDRGERFVRRQATPAEEAAQRRRSFSDYPHSPQEARPVRVPRPAPERDAQRRRHSHPRHYSSSSDSDDASVSPRAAPRRVQRSNEPPPITVRRVYTGSSEDSPRVIRTTMAPPPIPPSHMHSPRPATSSRAPSREETKRRSALYDIKEKISNFISPSAEDPARARSVSGSRGRRDGPSGSARGSREDIIPNSRLSRSWSEIDTDDTDLEEERRRRSRRPSRETREPHREKDRDRERERDRDRDRAARDRERDRERDRDHGRGRTERPSPRERDRAHSDGDRHRHERRERDRDRDQPRDTILNTPPNTRDRLVPVPSPAASAAASALHRDTSASSLNPPISISSAAAPRRRGVSDEDLSPTRRRWGRGPYLTSAVDGDHHHRRTSSHADLDRLDGSGRRWGGSGGGDWERVERGPPHRETERELRERDHRMRERERERERDRDRDRDRERERFREEGGERWRRGDDRVPRERERERDRERDRDRERERMPSPAMSGASVTGVGGRKYPDTMSWVRD
ncbi:hypothetical protein CHGG_01815 [Chaetomium globosum CBS 148.51]|uniref:DUF7514 domain-containing protein n=1 Tax=Chaetomium globosum (strain ATCC 6205 / CBS 148.51 / DSM 1962 / NBRC 6347 / NRRL 1970) TaxID=306901 RepID=Q2HD89_CHAGB|nr:uncharacterized protein CHGG_01815 [Chaetomium globosum CBS 148.51]EAQ93580.1 hypothetical protein CHGG_01815 [Chaetomium globosum CBS 148.51]